MATILYTFKRFERTDDYIVVEAVSVDGAWDKLWDCIIGVAGLFRRDYFLFSITKFEGTIHEYKFSPLIHKQK